MGRAYAELFFDGSLVTGKTVIATDEAGAVPDTPGPYTITVAGSATWVTDLGVRKATDGTVLKRVAAGPAAGEYSCAAGVYTFAAADKNTAMLISYTKTDAASGQSLVIANKLTGQAPFFQVVFSGGYGGQYYTATLNRCVSTKLTMATKLEDYQIPEFDFSAMADDAGNVGTLTFDKTT